ncbi:MAG: hypothetical protein IJT76_01605 [Clostridia bacterium]|nr:hypothetical protein [Clostridia bacterium]
MKKHGQRMELLGGLGLLWLAMASDGGIIGVLPTVLLGLLCVSVLLLGDMFTRPRKRRARRASPAARPVPANVVPFPASRAA